MMDVVRSTARRRAPRASLPVRRSHSGSLFSFSTTRCTCRPSVEERICRARSCSRWLNPRIFDLVHRIEPQAVEVIFGEPVAGVGENKIAHRFRAWAIEIHRRAPGRRVRVGEQRRVLRQIVTFRAEVIVDDVEQHRQVAGVGRIDEGLEVVGPAIAGIRRKGQHAVIAPVPAARETVHRHKFDGGDPEFGKVIELVHRRRKGAFGGERADVQLVEHGFFPRVGRPSRRRSRETAAGRSLRSGLRPPAAESVTPGLPPRCHLRAESGTTRQGRYRRRRTRTSRAGGWPSAPRFSPRRAATRPSRIAAPKDGIAFRKLRSACRISSRRRRGAAWSGGMPARQDLFFKHCEPHRSLQNRAARLPFHPHCMVEKF